MGGPEAYSPLSSQSAGHDHQPQRAGSGARLPRRGALSAEPRATVERRSVAVQSIRTCTAMTAATEIKMNQEYAAVRAGGAGLLDLSDRGRILVSGEDAAMFLTGLVTNGVKAVPAN